MSSTDDEHRKLIAEYQAKIDAALASFTAIGTPVDRESSLDSVRKLAEDLLGQPCLTRFSADGRSIEIVTPVIRSELTNRNQGA